eukprot:4069808-Amphidinium_carterae.1
MVATSRATSRTTKYKRKTKKTREQGQEGQNQETSQEDAYPPKRNSRRKYYDELKRIYASESRAEKNLPKVEGTTVEPKLLSALGKAMEHIPKR